MDTPASEPNPNAAPWPGPGFIPAQGAAFPPPPPLEANRSDQPPHPASRPPTVTGSFPPSPPRPQTPTKKPPKKLIVGLTIGAVGFIVLAILAVAILYRTMPLTPAQQVVKKYFEAIARADADSALSLVGGGDIPTLLTDEVLAESKKLAPITDITIVGEATDMLRSVTNVLVRYNLGTEKVETTVDAGQGQGGWKVAHGTGQIELPKLDTPILVNGTKIKPETEIINVFPGFYAITPANPYFIAEDDETKVPGCNVRVRAPDRYLRQACLLDIRPQMQTTLRAKAQALQTACLRSSTLTLPAPCGVDNFWAKLEGPAKNVKWTVLSGANALKTARFDSDRFESNTEATVFSAQISMRWRVSYTTKNGQRRIRDTTMTHVEAKFLPSYDITMSFPR